MITTEFHVWEYLKSNRKFLVPRLNTGKILLDTVYIVYIASIQFWLNSIISARWLTIDLLTPWLLVIIVRLKPIRSVFLVFLAAALLESHTSVPVGQYLVVYGIMATAVQLVNEVLLWDHWTPWVSSFIIAHSLVGGFDTFILLLRVPVSELDSNHIVTQVIRIIVATGFGLALVFPSGKKIFRQGQTPNEKAV